MGMAFITIQYNEGNKKKLNYKSVQISYEKSLKKTFNSGNFVKDWFDCIKFFNIEVSDNEFLAHSSSVNHFIMDGAQYDSAYLHIVDKKPVLKYVDESDEHYLLTQRDVYEGGIELFVASKTQPTWEELKELCK